MGISPETKLITKNTFLEIVVDEASAASDTRRRSFTDGAILNRERKYEEPAMASLAGFADEDACHEENPELQAFPQDSTAAICTQESGNLDAARAQQKQQPDQASVVQMAPMGYFIMPMVFMAEQSGTKQAPKAQAAVQSSSRVMSQQHEPPHPKQSKQAGAPRAPLSLSRCVSSGTDKPSTDEYTTLMLRNLPNQYNRDMLVDLLNVEGFAGMFNFVYLPIDFKTHAGLGYAFVDLISPQETERMRKYFEGFSNWAVRSEKICTVSWSHPEQQGFAAHVERYRNSPVMHDCVPDTWKPALFAGGMRVAFPPPTRKLRNPNIRNLQ